MADASQVVKEMAAEAEQGRTPPALERFLKERFGKPEQGLLSRWLSGPQTFEVRRIELFQDGGFFRRSCVFWVYAKGLLLEGSVLPAGGSFGVFSLGPDGALRSLNRRQDEVEALLQGEGRPLDECAPGVLASLIAEALGRQRNDSHAVLESAEHLARYDGGMRGAGGGYEVDARELERARPSISAPAISGNAGTGWWLEFCTVFGWMHEKRTLLRHRCRFSPDFRLHLEQEVLSRAIFSQTPGVIY